MEQNTLCNMLVNTHSVAGWCILDEQSSARRAKRCLKRAKRTMKRRERAVWKSETILSENLQPVHAYEDRCRILDHISDTFWHGVHQPSEWLVYASLHTPGMYGMEQLRSAA